jgi:hypothetical protein
MYLEKQKLNIKCRFSVVDQTKKINFFTSKNVDFYHYSYGTRFQDKFTTIEELIFKNLGDKEIKLMKTDPSYFKLNSKIFQEVDFFKKKNLADILKEEENKKYKDFRSIRIKVDKLTKLGMKK